MIRKEITEANTFERLWVKKSPVTITEGLIKTYPITIVVKCLTNLFNLSNDDKDVDDIIAGKSNYNGVIKIAHGANNCKQIYTILPNDESVLSRFEQHLNKYGYFNGGWVFVYDTNDEWVKIWWDKKFDGDATEVVRKLGKLYHICSSTVYDKISKSGLTPKKSQWKDFDNPERVYFFIDKLSHAELDFYANDFRDSKTKVSDEYFLLEIDISKVNSTMKFYADSRMPYAVYSLEGVPPYAITIIDGIKFNDNEI